MVMMMMMMMMMRLNFGNVDLLPHLQDSISTGRGCCTPGRFRGPNINCPVETGMSPRMSRQELHSGPKEPRHSTEGL